MEKVEKAEVRKAVKEKCIDFMKDAEQIKCIGAGGYGEVWVMKLKGHSPLLVQKICRKMRNIRSLRTEISCLSSLQSKYLPKVIYSGYTLDGKWCTVMQYFNGGTLDDLIAMEVSNKYNHKDLKITPAQKIYIAYHLAVALEYIHEQDITHG